MAVASPLLHRNDPRQFLRYRAKMLALRRGVGSAYYLRQVPRNRGPVRQVEPDSQRQAHGLSNYRLEGRMSQDFVAVAGAGGRGTGVRPAGFNFHSEEAYHK